MSSPEAISRAAGALLLDLLEQREPILSSAAFTDHVPVTGRELVKAGLLKPHDTELAAVDCDGGDDGAVAVVPAPHRGGYGYFSAAHGWVTVPTENLVRHAVDIPAALLAMTGALQWRTNSPAIRLSDDLWQIGSAHVLPSGPVTEVWFARRLGEESVRQALVDQVRRRPAANLRLVLTSTTAGRLGDISLHAHMVVSVSDVLAHDDGLAVDREIVAARMGGAPTMPSGEAIWLSPDGRTLIIHGSRIALKSRIHIAIVRLAVEAYRTGRRHSAAELLDKAGSQSGALHRAFGKKWPFLKPYLKRNSAGWGFDL